MIKFITQQWVKLFLAIHNYYYKNNCNMGLFTFLVTFLPFRNKYTPCPPDFQPPPIPNPFWPLKLPKKILGPDACRDTRILGRDVCVCVATIEKKFSSKKAYTLHSSGNWKVKSRMLYSVQFHVLADFFYGAAQ